MSSLPLMQRTRQGRINSQNKKLGAARKAARGGCSSRAPGPPHLVCPSPSSAPAQAPPSSPPPRNHSLQGQKHIFSNLFFHRRLVFPLLGLLGNKCSSPLSPFNWSQPERGRSPGSCMPGELLLAGPCTHMPGCWLLLEKLLNEQIQQMEICIRSICRNCKGFVMCLEKKNQHGFGQNRQTKQILHGKLRFKREKVGFLARFFALK